MFEVSIFEVIIMSVLATIIGICAGMYGVKQLNKKTPTIRASQVHFYVARDKYNKLLYLYLGKPIKGIDRFHACHNGCIVSCANSCSSCPNLSDFGLNPKDFENLKFEDEPVEVFLDLK